MTFDVFPETQSSQGDVVFDKAYFAPNPSRPSVQGIVFKQINWIMVFLEAYRPWARDVISTGERRGLDGGRKEGIQGGREAGKGDAKRQRQR